MKPLKLVTDPISRRSKFNIWMTHLKIVLNSFEETQPMLENIPLVYQLPPPQVDQAVFQLILAKCGHLAMNSIESTDHTSGYQAYVDLQRQCAQVNEQLQETAKQALFSIKWHETETATIFLHKFRLALSKCQHLGLKFTEHQRVTLFFSIAQRITRSSPYYVRIETLRAHRDLNPEPMMLADIESNLYGLDEELRNNNGPSQHNQYQESALYTKNNNGRKPPPKGP